MKNLKAILFLFVTSLFMIGCDVNGLDDATAIKTTATSNAAKIFDITTDNSGLVKITPTGLSASSFLVNFGQGTGANASATVSPGQSVYHQYPEGTYTVTITTYDIAGNATTNTYPLTVTYVAPTNLKVNTNVSGYKVTVTPSANFAVGGFLVYFGDVSNETGTKVTGTQDATGVYTGTVSHTYATAGTYTVKVVALSGGAANTTSTQTIRIYNPYSLPITFEDANQNYGMGGTFGGVDASVVANPFSGGINTSSKVWKFVKNSGAESWAGTWTPMSSPDAVPINMANGSKFKMMVYATEIGKKLHFQLEQASTGISNQSFDVAVPVANQWVELTFDFGSLGIPAGTIFKQYVFQYNLAASGTGEVIYIDNITQSN